MSHVVTSPGGMQLAIRDMAVAQARRGHNVCIAGGDFGTAAGRVVRWAEESNVRVVDVPQLRAVLREALNALQPEDSFGGLDSAIEALVGKSGCRPDVVMLHSPHLYGQRMARAVLAGTDAPLIGVVHQDASIETANILKGLRLAHVFTVNRSSRDLLVANGVDSVSTGILGIDLDRFQPSLRAGDIQPLACSAGGPVLFLPAARLQRNKGTDIAIRALALVREAYPNASLLLCDPGRPGDRLPRDVQFASELQELAETAGVSSAVWVGEAQGAHHLVDLGASRPRGFTPSQMPAVLRATARTGGMVIHPSHRDGFGLVIAEAMACGVPVVCSDIPGQREAAGRAALLFGHGHSVEESARHLAAGVLHVLDSPEIRTHMVQAGLEHAARFDRAASDRQVEATMSKLVSPPDLGMRLS